MEDLFHADVEAMPTYKTIYFKFSSLNPEDEDGYEMSIPRDESILSSFIRKLHAFVDTNGSQLSQPTDWARKTLKKNIGSFYVPKDKLNDVIALHRANAPAPDKLPNFQPKDDPINFFVTESVKLKENILLNGKVIKKGSMIKFYHEGKI